MANSRVTFADVQRAESRIKDAIKRTPCARSDALSESLHADIHLKLENLQLTGSFKARGALNRLLDLSDDEKQRGVIAASAGNHAQGVAHHAQRLGLRAVIVMPQATPMVKVERTRGFGAEVVLHGDSFDAARDLALQLAAEQGLTFVHPFDDPLVIAGQGTMALEMLRAQPAIDTLVVAVGGGGLISGIATAVRALKPTIEIIGVQASQFPAMVNAVKGTQHPQGNSTIAEGIAVGVPGQITRRLIKERVDDLVLVDEGDIEQAIVMLLEIEKTLVEGAGAAGGPKRYGPPRQCRRDARMQVYLPIAEMSVDALLLVGIGLGVGAGAGAHRWRRGGVRDDRGGVEPTHRSHHARVRGSARARERKPHAQARCIRARRNPSRSARVAHAPARRGAGCS